MINTNVKPLGAGLGPSTAGAVTKRDMNRNLDHYVFCLEDINLRDRQLSIRELHKGRIARLSNIGIQVVDMSEEALTREGTAGESYEEHEMMSTYEKNAWDQAMELYINYGPRGLTVLESLTGLPVAKVKAVEEYLLSDVPHSLTAFRERLMNVVISSDVTGQLMDRVRQELIDCINRTQAYRTDIVEKAEGEIAARGLPNGTGLNRVTSGIRFYAESLDRTLKADQLEIISKRQQEPVKIELPSAPALDPQSIAAIVAATVEALKAQDATKPTKK